MNAPDLNTAQRAETGKHTGKAMRRMEDMRFLTGRGRYVDDITLPRQLYAHFIRSPHAHARILKINTEAALAVSGVKGVYSAEDLHGTRDVPPNWVLPGSQVKGRPALAREIVRHVGECVAVVLAESPEAAADAGALVDVAYDPLPTVFSASDALKENAHKVHGDLPGNIATTFKTGNGGYEEALEKAGREIAFSLRNQRLVPFPIEGRAVNADFDPATERLTFYTAHQIPHMLRRMLAGALGFPEHKLRVISPDVGGGFGPKMHFYPEELTLARLSCLLKRPVKWTERRSENVAATTHGRDHEMEVRVAVQNDGKVLGLKLDSKANVGAYLSSMGTGVPTINVALFALGVYAIPHSDVTITCAYTNTTPVDAYRGAGRPEAAYMIERVMDRVALELGLDPAETRKRNFVQPDQMPYAQPTGTTLDTGEYAMTLDLALKNAGYEGLRKEQEEARKKGRYLGIGFSNYTETCGMGNGYLLQFVGFDRGGYESAVVRVHPDGRATVLSGSHSHGQGHVTTFAQIAADELGIAPEQIEVLQGDTDMIPFGIGTFNSRSVPVGGSAVKVAAGRVAAKMRRIAAHLLQCEPEKVLVEDGIFKAADGNGTVTVERVAHAAWTGHDMPYEMGIGLEETEFFHPQSMSSPYGAHIALVEVDPETGEVELKRYIAVDDCGVIINPLLARGQVHGGLAQGIGQALYEDAGFDAQGRPALEPSIPRFDMLPRFETDHTVTPTPTNPLGAKGLGEAGAIGAPPAIVNAAIDALWSLGVRALDMPLTPERVLTSIRNAANKETEV
ncbi:putative quinoline 2-oxidoreductase, large subunit [Tepidicaulis marinus]|uniref:Putative quinoline 2-oxidoreductase, large subunit n=1 Tax=Tepidicaulis marinus TaxID=1333998 RepID=A0A081BF04_9HYPH|nr:xanthine dehydrogenase family protein molybdopterin-binding subunit [Tepidicaulis marinus]GAK46622.1 putative quinoline 2-oxidoreductase, large subunit [Tepidicaulis marinus]